MHRRESYSPSWTASRDARWPGGELRLSADDRLLILAVHPDDESLCTGGLIQHALAQGAKIRVVFITDGDNNPWPQRFLERRWRILSTDRVRWGHRRRGEALAALACLGASVEDAQFWGFPDQGITEILMAGGRSLLGRLSNTIGEWKPSVLVIPSKHDLHPDHNSVAILVAMALERLSPPPKMVLWEYLVHAGRDGSAVAGTHLFLSPGQVAAKGRAILSHRTQMALCRRRFVAFALPEEIFTTPDDGIRNDAGPRLAKAKFVEESMVLTLDRLRRPARFLVCADTAGGAVAGEIRIPAFGDGTYCDARSGEVLARVGVVRGTVLVLPAAPFESATSVAVKFASGWGIFDRSGWHRLPMAAFPAFRREEAYAAPPRICCVVPCYNIAGVCGAVVRDAIRHADVVIAVNDGSTDETESVLREVADENLGRVQVLSFSKNRGKGVVLIDAFRHALGTQSFDVLVTLDGDGQHRPEDIPLLARSSSRGRYPLVIGERLARSSMPLRSRFGNTLTALIMRAFYPAAPTDTQSGFRAFRPDFAREVVARIEGGRYETELKMLLLALAREYRIGSVTIPTVYRDGNRLSHFRPLADSWRIYRTLLSWRSEAEVDRAAAISLDARPGA